MVYMLKSVVINKKTLQLIVGNTKSPNLETDCSSHLKRPT